MDEPTSEGKLLIHNWRAAEQELEAAKKRINGLECVLNNSIRALGKWMVPDDAKDGEIFCVWHGDSLIAVTPRHNKTDFQITIRKRGKSFIR